MHDPFTDGMTHSERVLTQKLELLHRNSIPIIVNFVISSVVGWLIADVYPLRVIAVWLLAVGAVCAWRLSMQWRFHNTPAKERCTTCAANRFALGAGAQGLLWGAICLGLPVWGDDMDFILLAVTAAGMSAGAVSTIAVSYPAYVSYTVSFAAPLTGVMVINRNVDISGAGAMIIIYYAAISFAAWRTSRFIATTIELSVNNQILKHSLERTRSERDAARTEKWSTLAQLSHELRTPLNAILGFSEAMTGEIFGSLGHPRYKEYAAHVHTSGRDLLDLAEELLLLTQGEAGTLVLKEGDVDPAELIRALIDLKAAIAGKAGLELQAYISAGLPMLKGDTSKIRLMLLNLLDNALKFTPSGGEVAITASMSAGSIVLKVSDSGLGMSAEQIPRALEPFGRAAAPLTDNTAGVGLGLPICKRLAELHGATLAVTSELGHGTVCTVTFPAARTLTNTAAAAA